MKYKTDSLLGSLAWFPKMGLHLTKNWLHNFGKLSVISFPNVLENLDHEKFPTQQFSVPYPHAFHLAYTHACYPHAYLCILG